MHPFKLQYSFNTVWYILSIIGILIIGVLKISANVKPIGEKLDR